MPVHLYIQSADMEKLLDFSKKHNTEKLLKMQLKVLVLNLMENMLEHL